MYILFMKYIFVYILYCLLCILFSFFNTKTSSNKRQSFIIIPSVHIHQAYPNENQYQQGQYQNKD